MRHLQYLFAFLLLIALASCQSASSDLTKGPHKTLTVTVVYNADPALSPETNVTVSLMDVTASATGTVVADVRRPLGITQPPLTIAINYDPAKIQPGHKYSVHARLEDPGNNLLLQTAKPYPVFEGKTAEDSIQVVAVMLSQQ